MLNLPLDMKFEDKLIYNHAEVVYSECCEHAERRDLEKDYVINKFVKYFSKIVKEKGTV